MDVNRPQLSPVLHALLGCVSERLDPPIARAVIIPGAVVPWDCEQVWVRLVEIVPFYHQQLTRGAGGCGPLEWTVTIAAGTIRCIGTINDRGDPPPAARMIGDAELLLADAEALEQGIECCTISRVQDLRIGQYTSLGAEGAYAGGEWTATFRITNCTDCTPEETP